MQNFDLQDKPLRFPMNYISDYTFKSSEYSICNRRSQIFSL